MCRVTSPPKLPWITYRSKALVVASPVGLIPTQAMFQLRLWLWAISEVAQNERSLHSQYILIYGTKKNMVLTKYDISCTTLQTKDWATSWVGQSESEAYRVCYVCMRMHSAGICSWVWNNQHLREIMHQPSWSGMLYVREVVHIYMTRRCIYGWSPCHMASVVQCIVLLGWWSFQTLLVMPDWAGDTRLLTRCQLSVHKCLQDILKIPYI